jgi:hypothetical protein
MRATVLLSPGPKRQFVHRVPEGQAGEFAVEIYGVFFRRTAKTAPASVRTVDLEAGCFLLMDGQEPTHSLPSFFSSTVRPISSERWMRSSNASRDSGGMRSGR